MERPAPHKQTPPVEKDYTRYLNSMAIKLWDKKYSSKPNKEQLRQLWSRARHDAHASIEYMKNQKAQRRVANAQIP